jgi:oxygen-dependent protoporphyrinogen oxidase
MSLRSAFPLFYDLEQEYGSLIRGLLQRQRDTLRRESKVSSPWTTFVTLRDGIGQLVEAWVKQLPVASLISGKRVQEIRPQGPRAYTVLLEGGEILQANAVVLTVPAYTAADLVEGFAPPLAATLREIPYASSATVSIGYRRKDVTHPLDGFGFIVPRVEHRKVLAATWTSTKFPHRVPDGHLLIRCFLGGALNEEILALNDAELVQMVRRELGEIMGISAEPLLAKVYRWQRATPQYVIGHQVRLASIDRLLQHYPGLYLTGAAYRGIGIPDCIHHGTLTAERLLSSQQIQG